MNTESRRQFLKLMLLTTASVALPAMPAMAAAPLPKLGEAEPTAKALGYLTNASKATKDAAYKKGSTCSNCALYQAAMEQGGHAPCAAFAGKTVSKAGWCRVWAPKPA